MNIAGQAESATLAHRLDEILGRIESACTRSGRRLDEVTLVGVTKTFPVEVVEAAREAGLRHFGENRVQELSEKAARIPGQAAGGSVTWHMIGHLQRNKARDVVRFADLFHGLDSFRLAEELDRRAGQEGRRLDCLLQVNVSGEASKSGVPPEAVADLLDRLGVFENLRLRGLMTVAEPVDDPEEVRPQFRLMRSLFDGHRARAKHLEAWAYLSMGMSSDFEVAIEEGATHVRIGSALFGTRT